MVYFTKTTFVVVSILLISLIAFSTKANSFFSYFESPIKIIVPFGAGGPADVIARNVEYAIENNSKIKVAVINRGGASGNIGMKSFLQNAQNEKSLLLTTENILLNKKYLMESYPKEIEDKVVPIYFFAMAPFILYGNSKFKNIENLIEESNHREIIFGTSAPGSGSYESYNQLCNVKKVLKQCRRVAYASSSAAILDLLANRLDVWSSLYANHQTFVSINTVKPLLILSKNKFEPLKEVSNSSGVEVYNWAGLFHIGLTNEEVQILRKALNTFFTKEKLEELGYDTVDPDPIEFWKTQKQIYSK